MKYSYSINNSIALKCKTALSAYYYTGHVRANVEIGVKSANYETYK